MSRRRLLGILLVGLAVAAGPGVVTAADAPAAASTLPVPLAPKRSTDPSGLAILASTDAGTTVQILVPSAIAGTTAVIHTGSCTRVGTDLVGLVGELVSGQVQATVPVPLATLADGQHVIVLHPGLDLTTVIACGVIPLTAVAPVEPQGPTSPPVSADCVGVPEWIVTIKGHLDRIAELGTELTKQLPTSNYLPTLANQVGQTTAIASQMMGEQVPPAAAAIQQQMVNALQLGVAAANDILTAFSTSDAQLYQDAIANAQQASDEILKVRTAVGELEGRCVTPPAAVLGGAA